MHRNDTGTTYLLFCQALPRTAWPVLPITADLRHSSQAPSSTALSGCPSRLPPASPFCGRWWALLLLRVYEGVTRRPGPGPNFPPRGAVRLPRPRMLPGIDARDGRRGKEPDFLYTFQKSVQIKVHIIGIMRRSQRRGRLSLITAADARDGPRPEKQPTLPKNRPKKLEILPRVTFRRRNSRPTPPHSRQGKRADGADVGDLARLPRRGGDGPTVPGERNRAELEKDRGERRRRGSGKLHAEKWTRPGNDRTRKSRMRV